MYSHFLALDDEKQQRIINAGLREFGRYGYAKTSAEQLAKSAGIAKGMIFHYFGSKQGMYDYLFEYAGTWMNRWIGEVERVIGRLDFIEQYRCISKAKLRAYIENPHMFEFLTMAMTQTANIAGSAKGQELFKDSGQARENIMSIISDADNTGLFREDIDIEKGKRYVIWLLDGYSNHLLSTIAGKPLADINLDVYWDEFDEILDDCKKILYK